MGLAETAKQLQAESVSKELQYLRSCRRYLEENSYEKMEEIWEGIKAFEESPEGQGMDGRRKQLQMQAEANRTGERRNLYNDIIDFAERVERRKKGGAAALIARNWKIVQLAEAGIEQRYEKEYQLSL